MGAGHLLGSYADTTVVTVLGGPPPAYPDPPSDWDALGGFVAGDDVVAVRREEDAAAMAVLESSYRWLEFADHQYLAPPDRPKPDEVAPVLAATIAELNPTSVFVPMGLGNPDHVMVHDASLLVRADESGQSQREWFCYEDHGYKHIPGLLAWRVAKLLRSKPWPTPAIVPHVPDEERKRRAIWCYTSQIPPLERDHALTARVEGPGARAVLAAGPAAGRVGRHGRLHLTTVRAGRVTARPGEHERAVAGNGDPGASMNRGTSGHDRLRRHLLDLDGLLDQLGRPVQVSLDAGQRCRAGGGAPRRATRRPPPCTP